MNRTKLVIPDRINILGQSIEINKMDDLSFNEGAWGRASVRKGHIQLQMSTKQHPVPQGEVEETYIHEVWHLILEKMGYDDLAHDEKFVTQMAAAWHQVLTTYEVDKKK